MNRFEKAIAAFCWALIALVLLLIFYMGYKEAGRLDEMYAECITTERDKFECHSLIYD